MTVSLTTLLDRFRRGDMSRRDFMIRASALGVSAAAATFLANGGNPVAAQATPGASPAASPARPSAGTEGLERGADHEVASRHVAAAETVKQRGQRNSHANHSPCHSRAHRAADGPASAASMPKVKVGLVSSTPRISGTTLSLAGCGPTTHCDGV